MKQLNIILLANSLLVTSILFGQGPGLGNLTYTSNELYKSIWNYTDQNYMGSTMATMHRGYLITTFHPDSGKPPGGILVWDVSNPRKPKLVKRVYNSTTASFREMHALPQHGDYILFQDGCGFQIWSFKDPANPQFVKRHCMTGYGHDDYGSTWQMFWQAPYIFIANGSRGFDVVDASDIMNPQFVKHVNTPRQVGPIFAVGNLLYTSAHDFGKGFTFFDISDPRNPKLINSYSNTENMYASSLNGNTMVISARGNSSDAIFSTYDVSDPTNIKKIASLNIGNNGEQLYSSTQDHFIFQGCQNEVVKIDASSPSQLKIAGRGHLVTGNVDHGQVTPMGNLIFVGNDHGTGSGFWVHQTTPDTKAPEVNMVVPKSNTVNQVATSRIGMTLSDNLTLESINQNTFIVRPIGGTALAGRYSYQFATINFSPNQPLQPNTTYEIVLPAGGIKDVVGNGIKETYTSYFSTGKTGDFPPAAGSTPWVFEEDKQVSLFWNSISNVSSYSVKRGSSPTGPFVEIATVNSASYVDKKVENDQLYYYTVSGKNNFGEGASTASVRAMPALYITDFKWSTSSNAWGPVEIDQSNGENDPDDGNYISLNGQTYSRGLGVHATSSVTYSLVGKKYQRFNSDIGVDDEVGSGGSVIFSVLVDNKEVFNSGIMTGESPTKQIDVDLIGASTLTLKVLPNGDEGLDHASWAGARFRLPQRSFSGTAHAIPGRIEAEHYDLGGEGIAYHETNTNGNEGKAQFRNDQVDIEETLDIDGAYNIGYTLTGEWLEYTVGVTKTGVYDLALRLAKEGAGGLMHIEIDGVNVTGPITVPNTRGWQTWQTATVEDISLTEGEHVMRIVFDSDYININYVEFLDLVTNLNETLRADLQIYPNPFGSNGFSIHINESFNYVLTDILGHTLLTGHSEGATSIGENLSSGTYILRVQTKKDSKDFKIIKK